MNVYELMVVFPVEEDHFMSGVELVRSALKNANVTITSEADPIDRDLAYEIKGKQKGRYVLFNIESEPQKIQDLNRQFKINQNILTYLFVRVEK